MVIDPDVLGNGSVCISLKFPITENVYVDAGLFDISDFTTAVIDFNAEELHINQISDTKYQVVYNKPSVPAGTYCIKFFLYSNADKRILINVYTELVRVVSGCMSSVERSIENLNNVYPITYNLCGGEWDESATQFAYRPDAYTVLQSVQLPTNIIYSGTDIVYHFAGWYTSSDYTDTNQINGWNAGEQIGNKVLYAKWSEATSE